MPEEFLMPSKKKLEKMHIDKLEEKKYYLDLIKQTDLYINNILNNLNEFKIVLNSDQEFDDLKNILEKYKNLINVGDQIINFQFEISEVALWFQHFTTKYYDLIGNNNNRKMQEYSKKVAVLTMLSSVFELITELLENHNTFV